MFHIIKTRLPSFSLKWFRKPCCEDQRISSSKHIRELLRRLWQCLKRRDERPATRAVEQVKSPWLAGSRASFSCLGIRAVKWCPSSAGDYPSAEDWPGLAAVLRCAARAQVSRSVSWNGPYTAIFARQVESGFIALRFTGDSSD